MNENTLNEIGVDATLAELATEALSVDASTLTARIQEEFERRPDLPGAIVFEDGRLSGVISRESFFQRLSRPFVRELFSRKPVKQFLDVWRSDTLCLPSDCTVHRATELVLARPHDQTYEPILVDFGERGVRLLDAYTLLTAQAQLLTTSRVIAQQRDAAEAANNAKSDFLAKVSHELRTPLHGILSYTRFGLGEVDEGERSELREFFENVQHNAETLLNLVNDLLDYSKLEAGRMALKLEKCPLAPLMETVVDEFRSLCAERDIHIRYAAPDDDLYVAVDEERFKQVVRNLLGNAVKFSPPGGTVYVRARAVNRFALLSVRDEGPGIPPEDLDRVFEKFFQSSRTSSFSGGTGLGLAICREIVTEHDGRIWAENNGTSGSIFYCELPQYVDVPADDEEPLETRGEALLSPA